MVGIGEEPFSTIKIFLMIHEYESDFLFSESKILFTHLILRSMGRVNINSIVEIDRDTIHYSCTCQID
jgi:hypothetical protein